MPKLNKEVEDHLKIIEYLLAGIILKREPNIKEVAKIIGCSDTVLSAMYPGRKLKNSKLKQEEDASSTKQIEENGKQSPVS